MFFENPSEILEIARRAGCAIFVVPREVPAEIPGAIILQPEEKTTITIEQVREVTARLNLKQIGEVFVVVRPAEKLGLDAANAFLKSLEEPGEKVHYILITDALGEILPTITSRAAIYRLKTPTNFREVQADEKVKAIAKRLMVAAPAELPILAEEIAKKKDGVRAYALSVLDAAIEMLYKSYFLTGKSAFLDRLPKFLVAYQAIAKNGHVKLHLVAELI